MGLAAAHARLSASSAPRWSVCPGSIKAGKGRNTTSAYAAEGTYAHKIASVCLDEQVLPEKWLGQMAKVEGFAVSCSQEMVDALHVYLNFVADNSEVGSQSWVEMRLDALEKIDADMGGTADYVNYNPFTLHLIVADLKYGSGKFVDPENNLQAIIYAIGVMLHINKPVKTVEVVIVQPRYEGVAPVRSWTFGSDQVLDFIADLRDWAAATRQENAPLIAGDHCQFCPAARDCPELEKRQHAVVISDFKAMQVYNPSALAKALTEVPLVKARIKAIEEFAYAEATQGREIPGYKLVEKIPRRHYKSEGQVIEWAQAKALDPFDTRTLLSPAQLEKKLNKDEKKELSTFVEARSSGAALVPEADKRPAVKRVSAADFGVIDLPLLTSKD